MEGAAGRRVERARHLARDRRALAAGHVKVGDRVEQHPRIGMLGPREERLRRRHLDQAAKVHHADARGDVIDDRQIVRDEQVGEPEAALQVDHQVQDLRLHRDVERRRGFVAHQELRLAGERAGDRDALPLAAREFVREFAAVGRRQLDLPQQVFHALLQVGLVLGEIEGTDRLGDDVEHAPARVEAGVRVLEDHLHAPAERGHVGPAVAASHVVAVELDRAGRRRIEPDHQARHRRLAATRLAYQREGLALGDLDVDAVDGLDDLARPALERAHQPRRRDVEVALQAGDPDELVGAAVRHRPSPWRSARRRRRDRAASRPPASSPRP